MFYCYLLLHSKDKAPYWKKQAFYKIFFTFPKKTCLIINDLYVPQYQRVSKTCTILGIFCYIIYIMLSRLYYSHIELTSSVSTSYVKVFFSLLPPCHPIKVRKKSDISKQNPNFIFTLFKKNFGKCLDMSYVLPTFTM